MERFLSPCHICIQIPLEVERGGGVKCCPQLSLQVAVAVRILESRTRQGSHGSFLSGRRPGLTAASAEKLFQIHAWCRRGGGGGV